MSSRTLGSPRGCHSTAHTSHRRNSESNTPHNGGLQKFNSIPGVYRIYDNGAIQVYDLSTLLANIPCRCPRRVGSTSIWHERGCTGPCLSRRSRLAIQAAPPNETLPNQRSLGGLRLVGAMAFGLFGAFAVRLLHLSPTPVSVVTLLVLFVLGLRRPRLEDILAGNLRRSSGNTDTDGIGTQGPDGVAASWWTEQRWRGAASPAMRTPSKHARPVVDPSSRWVVPGWRSLRWERHLRRSGPSGRVPPPSCPLAGVRPESWWRRWISARPPRSPPALTSRPRPRPLVDPARTEHRHADGHPSLRAASLRFGSGARRRGKEHPFRLRVTELRRGGIRLNLGHVQL